MEIKAQLSYLRIAPRKVRAAIDLIRGKAIKEAEHQLKFLPRRSSSQILKILKSAVANAKSNFNVDKENLFIKNIFVNEGVPYKRWRPMSRGRAYPIMKRTSHIILILGTKEGVKIENKKTVVTPVKPETKTEDVNKEKQIIKTPTKKSLRETENKIKSSNWVKRIFRRKSM